MAESEKQMLGLRKCILFDQTEDVTTMNVVLKTRANRSL